MALGGFTGERNRLCRGDGHVRTWSAAGVVGVLPAVGDPDPGTGELGQTAEGWTRGAWPPWAAPWWVVGGRLEPCRGVVLTRDSGPRPQARPHQLCRGNP